MNFKIIEFVPDPEVVGVYTYVICDSDGNDIKNPAADFLNSLYQTSEEDAQILKSQIEDTAYKYGIGGRKEASTGREGLYALPSKYDEEKITSRYRMYFWVFPKVILIGSGCFKPDEINGQIIKAYQEVKACNEAADELSRVSNRIEKLVKNGEIFIENMSIEIEGEQILEL